MMRTHTCGEINKSHVNQSVTLCGWVHRRRDHGKLIFIDVRDRYGITQIVFIPSVGKEAHKLAQELGPEFVVKVTGKVNPRPANTINSKIPTGEIEIAAEQLEILNRSKVPVFEIDDQLEVNEELKLTYRYLDIRRGKVASALLLRSKLCGVVRNFLNRHQFAEVETPVLTKSTPEGARDFLVPSRLNPGEFFALPQSPQLFKQILMVSGMDRYYQIVKCFRDEDLRADRQPEFTQIDMEMSFVTEEDIMAISEQLFKEIFKEVKGIDIPTPFPRMTHKEAMEKYHSDKPDTRKNPDEFSFLWVVDFPLLKYNNDEKRWDSEHHPFTSINEEDAKFLESQEYDKIRARSYDLVLNGVELGSGSVRIHNRELQNKIFNIIGLEDKEAKERFGFLLQAFEYGAPPHAGVAYGIDRLVAMMLGLDSIRDAIAFPKTQTGSCPMTQAPSFVDQKQLKELGIISLKKGGSDA